MKTFVSSDPYSRAGRDVAGATIRIVEQDGRLFAWQENGLVGILRVSELEFIHRMSWARMTFAIDEAGEIREMTYYGRFKAKKQGTEEQFAESQVRPR